MKRSRDREIRVSIRLAITVMVLESVEQKIFVMKNCKFTFAVCLTSIALNVASISPAVADEFETSEGGTSPYVVDNSDPTPSTSLPGEPAAQGGIVCDNDGWKFKPSSHSSTFIAKETFDYTNGASSGTDTFTFNASRETTNEYAVSVGISVTAGSAMFGEVQGSLNAEVRKSLTYGVSFGGSTSVPPRTTAIAKLGFRRTAAYGKSFYLTSKCAKTNVQSASIKAPYRAAWLVTKANM